MKISTKAYLDTRTLKSGMAQIKIVLVHNQKSALLNTDIWLNPDDWDKDNQQVRRTCIQSTLYNRTLTNMMYQVQEIIQKLNDAGELEGLTIASAKNKIHLQMNPDLQVKINFASTFKKVIEKKQGHTKEIYITTWRKIEEYCRTADSLTFEQVDYRWLTNFDDWLKQSCKPNTRACYLRNIRVVFNYAIDEDITSLYPFRKFKIKTEETEKRSLTLGDIRKIRTMTVIDWQEKYRDIFMLIFYLIGINIKDLLFLTEKNLVNGRIEYRRAKTGTLYSIKVEPEAQAIIDKYRGKQYLLCFGDQYNHTHYRGFTRRMNEALKKMGDYTLSKHGAVKYEGVWPTLTSYAARHSWATIAYNLIDEAEFDIISQALGHKTGSKVTQIYIKKYQKRVDIINRKIIDTVIKSNNNVGDYWTSVALDCNNRLG